MIYFFYGVDQYRASQHALRIREEYVKNFGDKLTYIRVTPGEVGESLGRTLRHRSLFDGPTLIYARDVLFSGEVGVAELIELFKASEVDSVSEVILIAQERGDGKDLQRSSKELFSFFNKNAHHSLECVSLTGTELQQWLIGYAKDCGATLSPRAGSRLIELMGSESMALAQEVEKLANYKYGGMIGESDVGLLVSGATEINIFDLVDAIATKNKNRAFELLYRALKLQSDPYRLLAPIMYQFRNMLMAKDPTLAGASAGELAKVAGLHPYVAQKTLSQARPFELADLKRLYGDLAHVDIELKSGVGDASTLLHRFLLSL